MCLKLLNIEETVQRQQKLNEYIRELSEHCFNADEIRDIFQKLSLIYKDEFRHQYSEFFPLLIEMEEEEKEYCIAYLLDNLSEICNYIELNNADNRFDKIYYSIFKLKDHLNLECARYCISTSNQEQIKSLEKQITTSTEALCKANKELKRANLKLRNVQTELIAVLSIFSAIVVTFSGSMSFIGGALQGMENAPFAKTMFFVSLCGFIVFNLIYLMLYIVSKITERNIYAKCKTLDCSCKEKCNGFMKIYHRLPYVFWTNCMLLFLLAISFIMNVIPICYRIIIFYF